MNISVSIAAVTVALIATNSLSAAALEAYKTKKEQVVVTGLPAQKKYEIQYTNDRGKSGFRNLRTNSCGQVLISKAAKFQLVIVNGQSIIPPALPVQEHRRCSPRRSKV